MRARLSHVDRHGDLQMVDISGKPVTAREAIAGGCVKMSRPAFETLASGSSPKGDVLTTARIAGIQAAKRAAELIPLCHPLALTLVDVSCTLDEALPGVRLSATVRCEAQTGAEMEALTAISGAALTIIDMMKSADRWMTIEMVGLSQKRGGKSGRQQRPANRAL